MRATTPRSLRPRAGGSRGGPGQRHLRPPGTQLRLRGRLRLRQADRRRGRHPGGNWSSYPPHKHDENRPGEETALEEIYYFEIDGPHGFGYQRVSPSREGGSEVLAEVRSGDAVLVPDGWHGPSIAQPGHSMYYLNVMAGPGAERQWRICFHPDHTEGYR